MPKTLDQVLKTLRKRAKAAGPREEATFEALDEHYSQVARELEQLRSEQGLSQRELAKRSRLDQAEVSRILTGRSQPRVPTAQRLARAMGAELRVVPSVAPRVRSAADKKKPKRK